MSWTDGLNDLSGAASNIISALGEAGLFGTTQQRQQLAATYGYPTGASGATYYLPSAPATSKDWSTILLVAGLGVLVLAIFMSRGG
jgi:hypothetical protein